ncbi:hypothetical protein CRD60_02890 [Bifidobacterium aemilianum]|uniref:Uncharacterized protein n=1 Tax=Bifidobacterium aemilianum TaxID=2493120 RepID=A0A366K8Q2_9BIFI|nr:hypothetical protein CRD60_02890 [Bifidobacterium aemilianum]
MEPKPGRSVLKGDRHQIGRGSALDNGLIINGEDRWQVLIPAWTYGKSLKGSGPSQPIAARRLVTHRSPPH